MGKKTAKSTDALLKKKIRQWVAQAQKRFLLQAWTVFITWTGKDDDTMMTVACTPEYRKATIEVNLKVCTKTRDSNYVRSCCYHEMAHILIKQFVTLAESRYISLKQLADSEEELAEIIAKIVLR